MTIKVCESALSQILNSILVSQTAFEILLFVAFEFRSFFGFQIIDRSLILDSRSEVVPTL
jgi:hypothetical protein